MIKEFQELPAVTLCLVNPISCTKLICLVQGAEDKDKKACQDLIDDEIIAENKTILIKLLQVVDCSQAADNYGLNITESSGSYNQVIFAFYSTVL